MLAVPVEDVIELAADLDVIIPERVDRRTLLETCVPLIIARGQRTGLPFSKYDLEDLKELGSEQLTALGRIQGLRGRGPWPQSSKLASEPTRRSKRVVWAQIPSPT